jgi:hypothetical protein
VKSAGKIQKIDEKSKKFRNGENHKWETYVPGPSAETGGGGAASPTAPVATLLGDFQCPKSNNSFRFEFTMSEILKYRTNQTIWKKFEFFIP